LDVGDCDICPEYPEFIFIPDTVTCESIYTSSISRESKMAVSTDEGIPTPPVPPEYADQYELLPQPPAGGPTQ